MADFLPFGPTGLDTPLIPSKVSPQAFIENIFLTDFQQFMGSSPFDPIQVEMMNKGDGETITFSLSKAIDYKNFIQGPFNQVSGKGQVANYLSDTLKFQQQAVPPITEYGNTYMQLATPINMTERTAALLQEAHRRNIVYQILKAACSDIYPDPATEGPTQDRVFYGNQAYSATINAGIASMTAGTGFDQDGSSVEMINFLRMAAVMGSEGGFEDEKKISPVRLETVQGAMSPTYLYFQDPLSFQKGLRLDTSFGSRYYGRGVIESEYQPSGLKGCFFRGAIEDVLIFDVPELANFRRTVGGIRVAHNLFVGAQAWKLIWGKMPWVTPQVSDFGRIREWTLEDIRGQKAITFESYRTPGLRAECGLIHSFCSIGL